MIELASEKTQRREISERKKKERWKRRSGHEPDVGVKEPSVDQSDAG